MKAVTFHSYGSAAALQIDDVPEPALQANEILIQVRAAGINPADWRLRNGQFKKAFRLHLPFIPGCDVAGDVVAVGKHVSRYRIGDPVSAMLPLKAGGGYAEFAKVNEHSAAIISGDTDWISYAATPLAGLTAWQGLHRHGCLKRGQTVLINGASGGVGSFAVQLAQAHGARVTGVASAKNAEFVRDLGAAEVIPYDNENAFQGPRRFDLIFDTIAKESFWRWSSALKSNGVLVTVNPIIGKVLPRIVTRLFGVNTLASFFVQPNGKDLEILNVEIASQHVRPQVQAVYGLEEAAAAQTLSEEGHVRGKLVLRVGAAD